MSVLELKAKIHQLVDEADDEALLQTWFDLLSGPSQTDEVFELTPELENRFAQSMQSIREGRVYSDEYVQAEIKEWLQSKKR